jgi:glycerol-3-phosphate dehydrogenase
MVKYTMGLKVYDWISGKLTLGASVFISRKKTMQSLPGINADGLLGGVLYHDGQFDDSRLAINLAQSILENGGCAINYMKVTSLLKDGDQKINGAFIEDAESGKKYKVEAKAVVNATGVFVDAILQMDNASGKKTICSSCWTVHRLMKKKRSNR